MKPGTIILVVLLPLSAVLLQAQSVRKRAGAPVVNSPQQIAQEIQHMESTLRIALMKGDASWFQEHLAENYAETDADGRVSSRSEVIEFYRTTQPEYDTWNLSDGTARTYNGNTVILTGKIDLEGTVRGQRVSGAYRFTRVWIKQGLEWQLAASQITRIAG